eukprot:CAMPEP_0172554986 /NCGR_PEP_ID=MMETSP1067-20121228/57433_1 /TAXON_ID=265564 ORGANISM="Thalassiosira punctigera, Strain Tpunct2005C2" /NCGR_SAMPLE_ID=MMETSP1067 /ASSEMBLY_ACC=CAM_ASM_000444 /LENGTH=579 /DNA_ID=CAMNT_0013343477 /DNA_START=33 /DNA_END=1772 /DNA_ORIENTATION=+
MPTATENDEESKAKPSIEVKQLQRYYTVLRDFMAYLHSKDEIYPPNHEFTQDELSCVTPQDVVKWMNVKLYNKEDPEEDARPLNGSHHTLDYYKKSISYFMPSKELSWDEDSNSGNPTRSQEVNDIIKRVREFDTEIGYSKSQKRMRSPAASAHPAAKMARTSLPPNFAPATPVGPMVNQVPMQKLLRTMHQQNASFIDLFSTLSRSLDQFKTTLQTNNAQISTILATLTPAAASNQAAASGFVGGAQDNMQPTTVGTSMLDWQYVHPDGVRRRVPPTWTFPHSNLQEMYLHWHCGDYQNRISPMKYFQNTDVSFLGKRARMNLSEVKNLMITIDEEATRKGKIPGPTMTLNQAAACFQAGLSGLKFSATTPTGKARNIMRLKWSTLIKYQKSTPTKDDEETGDDDMEKARQELVVPVPSLDDPPHDKWWYEHDDGVKRRVPSTWKFPMLGVEDMYILWHCEQEEEKLSPMKFLQATDVSHVKRSKSNLSEVRAVMTIIDLEAAKKGMEIKAVMTPEEAKECCKVGYTALNILATTPDGRTRDVLRMKWSSAVRLKNPGGESDTPEAEDAELPEAEVDV